ncbi:MAG: type II secretion system protein [Patescibacteria group bacterium]|nr:type II secretion system protein [Patescibacteria group bacterium]
MPQAFSKKGFTLIELLVVIVVIGILATLATVGMKSARSKATDSKKVSEVRSVSTALEMYMMDEGQYPPDIQNKWGQPLVGPTSGKTYMTLPKQLSGSSYGSYCRGNDSIYIYNWINNGTSYTLSYCLDNPMNSCPPGPKTARPNLVMDCDNQTSACLPDCTNTDGTTRSCGDNGCGGSCGSCGGSLVCKEDTGSCVACVGDGDCSGSGQHCIGNACLPCRIGVPADCSLCQTCNASNTCEPVAVDTVEGRCSTVGCGTGKCTATQTCGFNNNFETCTGGFCIADGSCCTPETCASRGFNCGTFNSTNCPGVVVPSCGTCATGSCTNNQCCTPQTAAEVCGNQCSGTVTEANCGSTVTCDSSVCASNSCVDGTCCVSESLATTCAGNKCGMVTNNCGQSIDCGTSQCNDSNPCTDDICSATTHSCTNPTKNCGSQICRPSDGVCVGCLTDANCSGTPATPKCKTSTGTCVQCLDNTHCASYTCLKCSASTNTCVPQSNIEDINDQCTASTCYTGNCSGSGASCGYFASGSRGYCPSCQQCTGGPSCSSCTVCCKSDGSGNCGSTITRLGWLSYGYTTGNCSGSLYVSKDGLCFNATTYPYTANCSWNNWNFLNSYNGSLSSCQVGGNTIACPGITLGSTKQMECLVCQ